MTVTLTCISLWQPWASLLFVEDPALRKVHETRKRALPPKYRGMRVGIHATLYFPSRLPAGLHDICVSAFGWDYRQSLPRGAVLGTLELVGAVETAEARPASEADRIAGDWSARRWAWLTQGPERFERPLPRRGLQGWFSVELPA